MSAGHAKDRTGFVLALIRKRGTPAWDAVLYGSGAAGLVGIPLVLRHPEATLLVGLLLTAILIHGPVSFLFQGSFEPVLMWCGSLYDPLLVAAIATAGNLYIETVNYALFRAARGLRLVQDAIAAPRMGRMLAWFQRTRLWAWCQERPFWMVVLCTASPVPDTLGRLAAVAHAYPMRPYITAHFVGRFPRFWFWAWLGSFLPVNPRYFQLATLASVVIGLAILGVVWLRTWYRRRRGMGPSSRDSGPNQPPMAA